MWLVMMMMMMMMMEMSERGPRHSCCLLYSGACIGGSSLGTYKPGKAIPPPRNFLSEPAEQQNL